MVYCICFYDAISLLTRVSRKALGKIVSFKVIEYLRLGLSLKALFMVWSSSEEVQF